MLYLMIFYAAYYMLRHLFGGNPSKSISNQNTKSKNAIQQKLQCLTLQTLSKPSKTRPRTLPRPFWKGVLGALGAQTAFLDFAPNKNFKK